MVKNMAERDSRRVAMMTKTSYQLCHLTCLFEMLHIGCGQHSRLVRLCEAFTKRGYYHHFVKLVYC